MIKKYIFSIILLLIFYSQSSSSHHHGIPSETKSTDYRGDLRLIFQRVKWTHLLEMSYASRDVEDNYKHALIGSRFRLAPNWKIGLFAKREYGAREDSDWTSSGWKNVESRGEFSSVVEFDYRLLLGYKTPSVFSIRTRYLHNFDNDNDTIKIRPSLYIFPSSNWSYFLRYEAYIPLNYSDKFIYEHWGYLATSYSFTEIIKIGPFVSYAKKSWKIKTTNQNHNALTLGLSMNLYY